MTVNEQEIEVSRTSACGCHWDMGRQTKWCKEHQPKTTGTDIEEVKNEFWKLFGQDDDVPSGHWMVKRVPLKDILDFFAPHLSNKSELKKEAVREFVYYCREKEKSDAVVMEINNKWLMFELERDNPKELEVAVVNEFIKASDINGWDYRYINYKWFEAEGFERQTIKPIIKRLLEAGVIDYQKGMFTEDGEMFGSGWGLVSIEKAKAYLSSDEKNSSKLGGKE